MLDGGGNVDDFFINDPAGAYRAATFRRMSPAADEWSIYWADARREGLDPPMRGRFDDGVGVFWGHDSFAGRDIQVRFVWSDIGPHCAVEQALSTDGVAWEVNWVMRFERERTPIRRSMTTFWKEASDLQYGRHSSCQLPYFGGIR